MDGDQGLVGSHDVLAIADGREYQLPRGVIATDQLDHDIDTGIVHQVINVGAERHVPEVHILAGPSTGNPGDPDIAPGPAGNQPGVAGQDIKGTAADGSQSADSDTDVFQTLTSDPEGVLMNYIRRA